MLAAGVCLHTTPAGGHARSLSQARRQAQHPAAQQQVSGRVLRTGQAAGGGAGEHSAKEAAHHRDVVVDLRPQPGFQAGVRGGVCLCHVRHLRELLDPSHGALRAVALPQRGGLLRITAHREDGVHHVHGVGVGCMRGAQRDRARLPHSQSDGEVPQARRQERCPHLRCRQLLAQRQGPGAEQEE